MSAELIQDPVAAFPDRRGASGLGLAVRLAAGNDGRYLAHRLAAAPARLHVRVLLVPRSLAGGAVVILRGLDAAGAETFRVDLEPQPPVVVVTLAGGQVLAADLPGPLDWHCLEVGLDRDAGAAGLRVNGVPADSLSAALADPLTIELRLGGMFKQTLAAGEIHLDEWVVGDDYIGPVTVAPHSPYADDPARWLVVYNTASSDSVAFAAGYARARGVPRANLCGLPLSLEETIDATAFAALDAAISDYLDRHGLGAQVMGILLGQGVPGYAELGGASYALAALLHARGPGAGQIHNPLAEGDPPGRPQAGDLAGLRLTARIDAPDLDGAMALLDRALRLEQAGLGSGASARIWLDPFTAPSACTQPLIDAMLTWSTSLDAQATRLPLRLSARPEPMGPAPWACIDHDGFFWGWSPAAAPAGFFADPPRCRAAFVALSLEHATATGLRAWPGDNPVSGALHAGYAAAAVASRGADASSLPGVGAFFAALRRSWTLAEAWFVTLPVLRSGLFLAGDPLLRLSLPAEGFDVFGPLARLEDLDPAQPVHRVRSDAHDLVLDATLRPADGVSGLYVVRVLDALGRSDAGLSLTRVMRVGDAAREALAPPLWPDYEGWPVAWAGGRLVPLLLWEPPGPGERLEVELLAQAGDATPQPLAEAMLPAGESALRLEAAAPAQRLRLAWRLRAVGGASWQSVWSAPVDPPPVAGGGPRLLEVRP